ncbi:hypothetical protein [Streptomyces himalayensis]|nr:hypothetical protein [Streptomyces himalayensis]
MKICAKCDQVIRPDEPHDEIPVDSASLAGTTMYRHKTCPPKRR